MFSVVKVSKGFGDKILFQDLTHSFPEGERIGLIGANGAGKTSLLNIICGLDQSEGVGSIVKKQGIKIGYLPQEINPHPEATVFEECFSGHTTLWPLFQKKEVLLSQMEQEYSPEIYEEYEKAENDFQQFFGHQLEGEISQLLKGLGFAELDFKRNPKDFSGGWRMRLELAKVLINNPNILVLDEPTNHLDLPSLMFLEEYLLNFKGTLLFVSHDQDLLDRLATKIVYLRSGKISEYAGNFSDFLDRYALEKAQGESQKKALDQKIKQNQSFVDRFGAKASKAAQANSRKKMISRLQTIQDSIETDGPQGSPQIKMPFDKQSSKIVLTTTGATFGYTKPLISNLNLQIMRAQKIAVIGTNGIGKSTMLKTLMGEFPLIKGEYTWGEHVTLGYYAQSQVDQLNLKKSAFYNVVEANPNLADHMVRGLLGSLMFKEVDAYKNVGVMSGGEKSRVGLACLIAQKANTIIMDEPTNHLDMVAMEKLADALVQYAGTLIFVSHDRRFINRVATHILGIQANGAYALVEGQLEDYFAKYPTI